MGAVKKIIEIEQFKLEFEGIEDAYQQDVFQTNKSWNNYWYNYFKKRFTNEGLLLELEKNEELIKYYREIAEQAEKREERTYKEYELWHEENISLGKRVDDLEHQVNALKEKNITLRDKIKVYEADKSLVKRFAQSVQLKAENSVLREHNNELKVKAAVNGATTLSQKQEKQIVDYYNLVLSKTGASPTKADREAIAQKVGTSESTVYRRIKKHEQQQ